VAKALALLSYNFARALEVSAVNKETKEELVRKVPFWHHSIDLGDGVVTPGIAGLSHLQSEWERMRLPDLTGKQVLDIGAWDGFYSFEAEKRGATRVLALDHYVWNMRMDFQHAYWEKCKREGVVPSEYYLVPGALDPGLAGKAGFDTAHRILGSRVEQLVTDFMTVDLEKVGSFDVVLFRGVLYHMREPLKALTRVALFTRELALIQTAAIYVPGFEHVPLFEFYGSNELNHDVSNWWAPNLTGLINCCHAAGFRRVEPVSSFSPPEQAMRDSPGHLHRCWLTVHAWH
jgi:tRNA (mo5U34)-methyltransferase